MLPPYVAELGAHLGDDGVGVGVGVVVVGGGGGGDSRSGGGAHLVLRQAFVPMVERA